ncbi:MAG: hypothetical protein LBB48_01250, partial [Treponema sp.]|nr:hypothetical protein [Treponema sp.]
KSKKEPKKPYTIKEAVDYPGWLGGPKRAPGDGPPGVKTIRNIDEVIYTAGLPGVPRMILWVKFSALPRGFFILPSLLLYSRKSPSRFIQFRQSVAIFIYFIRYKYPAKLGAIISVNPNTEFTFNIVLSSDKLSTIILFTQNTLINFPPFPLFISFKFNYLHESIDKCFPFISCIIISLFCITVNSVSFAALFFCIIFSKVQICGFPPFAEYA